MTETTPSPLSNVITIDDERIKNHLDRVRLKVPKLRAQTFEMAIIERYRRRESAVEERYRSSVGQTISRKITRALYESLSMPEINDVRLSFHVYPEDWDEQGPSSAILQPVLVQELKRSKVYLGVKRLMDIVGSSVALIVGLPFLLAIALAVRPDVQGPRALSAGTAWPVRFMS